MSEQPAYYAIIPANVRYSNVTANAKLLYGEITALSNKSGYCWASNDYFARLYNVHSDTISGWVRELRQAGFVESVIEKGTERKLYILQVVGKKTDHWSAKSPTTGRRKDRHNNTVNNTTNTGEQSSREEYVIVSSLEEERPPKVVKFDPVPLFILFKSQLGLYPLAWKTNKTQRQSAENLVTQYGLEQVRKALEFYRETKDEPFVPQILSPYDLDNKWHKLLALKKK